MLIIKKRIYYGLLWGLLICSLWGQAETITIAPEKDTYVDSEDPNATNGESSKLKIWERSNGTIQYRTYFQFMHEGISHQGTNEMAGTAILRLFCTYTGQSSMDLKVYPVESNNWDENISWATKPEISSNLITTVTVDEANYRDWVDFDLSDYIKETGTYSFVIIGGSSQYWFGSKESDYIPRLILSTEEGYVPGEEPENPNNGEFVPLDVPITHFQEIPVPEGYSEPRETSLNELKTFKFGYPRVHHYRAPELALGPHAGSGDFSFDYQTTYNEWADTFDNLNGITGKTWDEELLDRYDEVMPAFQRFAEENPDQMVMFHIAGRAFDPRFNTGKYHPTFWLYYEGTLNETEIPATTGLTTVKVKDAKYFMEPDPDASKYDYVIIVPLNEDGTPNWNLAEETILRELDKLNNTLTLERACYGTEPLSFDAGKAYLAAHSVLWKRDDNDWWGHRWMINMSSEAPLNPHGKNAVDVFSSELGDAFNPENGEMKDFDGIEFDMLLGEYPHTKSTDGFFRPMDMNGDGIGDHDNNDTYALGIYDFGVKLRQKMGPDKLLVADGAHSYSSRNFKVFNGMISEGWPEWPDSELNDWSGGINRLGFWLQNYYYPRFSFVYNKWKNNPENNIHRAVFAMATILEAGITLNKYANDQFDLWDELVNGKSNEQHWLGYSKSDLVRHAKEYFDLLESAGKGITNEFIDRFSGSGLSFDDDNDELKISSSKSSGNLEFKIDNLPADGDDWTMFITVRSNVRQGRPAEEGRLWKLKLRNSSDKVLQEFMCFSNQEKFEASFYCNEINSENLKLEIEVEGTEDIWLSNCTVHASPDVLSREFDNGMVLVNPSRQAYSLKIQSNKYSRIDGAFNSDINNGQTVNEDLTIPKKDGLFLVKDNSSAINQHKSIDDYKLFKRDNLFVLQIPGKEIQNGNLLVLDCLGRKIINKQLHENYTSFDLSGCAAGVYIVTVKAESGCLSQKIVND